MSSSPKTPHRPTPACVPWPVDLLSSVPVSAPASLSSPTKTTASLLWSTRLDECGRSNSAIAPPYRLCSVRADQGQLEGLRLLDVSLMPLEWLVIHASDIFCPAQQDCGKYASVSTRNPQHTNTDEFVAVMKKQVASLATQCSTSTTCDRVVKDFAATAGVLRSMGARYARTWPSTSPLGPPMQGIGYFIGGHSERNGDLPCCQRSRFTPEMFCESLRAGLHQRAIQQQNRRAQRLEDGNGPNEPGCRVVVCIGVCCGGGRWVETLLASNLCDVVLESPLWGRPQLQSLPPSQRKPFQTVFHGATPLFLEGRIAVKAALHRESLPSSTG